MKTILVTGATDGIGLATARALAERGHRVLLHGRNPAKLEATESEFATLDGSGPVENYVADLSRMSEVEALAAAVAARHRRLDVLINNAGVFKTKDTVTPDGLDVRFAVNTLAPCLLTRRLLPLMDRTGRVINLSSAAQSPIDLDALAGNTRLSDFDAYAQSKLALTMWSQSLAQTLGDGGPAVVAVNPGSLLATRMVKEAFGSARAGVDVGADILVRAALDDEFATASGKYFDNDAGRFASPHADALDARKTAAVVSAIEKALRRRTPA